MSGLIKTFVSTFSARRRGAAGAFVAMLAVSAFAATAALADAPDPVLSSTTGSVVVDGSGNRVVTIQGSWEWTTRTTDCNLDKRAVGYAVDWNDPTHPGNLVVTLPGPVPVDVGVATGTAFNPFDNLVYATPTAVNSTDITVWRGGCGTYGPHGPTSYNTGTWGPISHVYPASYTGPITTCAIMYDVHLETNGGEPKEIKEITAGGANHNPDSSAEKNQNTPLGNGCFTVTLSANPTLVTDASADVSLGSTIKDTANLSGGFQPTGTITFDLYGPNDQNCAGPAIASDDVTVNGNGNYDSPDFLPTSPGTYRWVASYSGDANNGPATGACNDLNESVEVLSVLIDIDKTGPATAIAGSLVTYTLVVTNTGQTPFAEADVVIVDPLCTPVLQSKGADATPTTFDPGDVWSYTCGVQTSVGQTVINNVATVTGTAGNGTQATDSDPADTTLEQPAPPVTPFVAPLGVASISEASSCIANASKRYTLKVTGNNIKSVTFYVDGRKVGTDLKASGQGVWSVAINPTKYNAKKTHKIKAVVSYTDGTSPTTKTLNASFKRCVGATRRVSPRFTG